LAIGKKGRDIREINGRARGGSLAGDKKLAHSVETPGKMDIAGEGEVRTCALKKTILRD